jgi:hypothetical protein
MGRKQKGETCVVCKNFWRSETHVREYVWRAFSFLGACTRSNRMPPRRKKQTVDLARERKERERDVVRRTEKAAAERAARAANRDRRRNAAAQEEEHVTKPRRETKRAAEARREAEREVQDQKHATELRRKTERETEIQRQSALEAIDRETTAERQRQADREREVKRQAEHDSELRRRTAIEIERRYQDERDTDIRRQAKLDAELDRKEVEARRAIERVKALRETKRVEALREAERVEALREAKRVEEPRETKRAEAVAAAADARNHKKTRPVESSLLLKSPESSKQAVYLHIAELDRVHAAERYREYVLGGRLGSGQFGEVSATCKVTPVESCSLCRINKRYCPYALKVVQVDVGKDGILPRTGAERDVYYLQKLQGVKVDGKPIVPVFYDAWMQNEPVTDSEKPTRKYYPYYLVLERFDGDMSHLAAKRLETWRPTWTSGELYHESEMTRMFRIAAQIGVFDGDIKPDQFLYRNASFVSAPLLAGMLTPPANDIVLTDFGFVGEKANSEFAPLLGWPSDNKTLGCPVTNWRARDLLKSWSQLSGDPGHVNVLILEMSIVPFQEAYVALSDSDVRGNRVQVFGGVQGLNRDAYAPGLCRNYTNAYVRNWRNETIRRGNESLFILDMDSLTSPSTMPNVGGARKDRTTGPEHPSATTAPAPLPVSLRETKFEEGNPYDSVRVRREEHSVVASWNAVVRAFRRHAPSIRARMYRRLSRLIHPDKWAADIVPDYAEISKEPDLILLKPQLDTFWNALSARRTTWSPQKLNAFLNFAFKQLDASK